MSPHPGIEPGTPSYRPSMLTTTPMGPVILSSLHWVFDSKCRTSPPRSADGDRYRRRILPAAPCYELIPSTGNYRLLRLRNGTVARGGGDRSRKQIKGLSPHPGIEPGSPSYRPSMLTNYTNGTSYLYWNLYIGYFIPVYNTCFCYVLMISDFLTFS